MNTATLIFREYDLDEDKLYVCFYFIYLLIDNHH